MPDHHTTIHLLGVPVPVTVTWSLGGTRSDPEIEIEQVTSDVLGDITDRVFNDCLGTTFTVGKVEAPIEGHDPLRALLFGQPVLYTALDPRLRNGATVFRYAPANSWVYMLQYEPRRPQIGYEGTLYQKLDEEIWESDAFANAQTDRDNDF